MSGQEKQEAKEEGSESGGEGSPGSRQEAGNVICSEDGWDFHWKEDCPVNVAKKATEAEKARLKEEDQANKIPEKMKADAAEKVAQETASAVLEAHAVAGALGVAQAGTSRTSTPGTSAVPSGPSSVIISSPPSVLQGFNLNNTGGDETKKAPKKPPIPKAKIFLTRRHQEEVEIGQATEPEDSAFGDGTWMYIKMPTELQPKSGKQCITQMQVVNACLLAVGTQAFQGMMPHDDKGWRIRCKDEKMAEELSGAVVNLFGYEVILNS
ncbi:MAG: hypothetical protein Q9178_007944 [Gyalolechia marmorata]